MDRITTRIEEYVFVSDAKRAHERLADYEDTGLTPKQILAMDEEYAKMAKELGEYRKLEEQGRLIVLPCKMWDTVYHPNKKNRRIFEYSVIGISVDMKNTWIRCGNGYSYLLGMEVFITKEEAEKALEEMGE